jgi:hypothetical protein
MNHDRPIILDIPTAEQLAQRRHQTRKPGRVTEQDDMLKGGRSSHRLTAEGSGFRYELQPTADLKDELSSVLD